MTTGRRAYHRLLLAVFLSLLVVFAAAPSDTGAEQGKAVFPEHVVNVSVIKSITRRWLESRINAIQLQLTCKDNFKACKQPSTSKTEKKIWALDPYAWLMGRIPPNFQNFDDVCVFVTTAGLLYKLLT